MTGLKRVRPDADDDDSQQPSKRRREGAVAHPTQPHPSSSTSFSHPRRDLLSPLSDELLVRILSFLNPKQLLAVAPVSRRFYRLAADSQLWKALYYARFVLPRAMRIPGFRDLSANGNTAGKDGGGGGHRLRYPGRRAPWADGRRGGVVDARKEEEEKGIERQRVDWKRQYKIRYNWARGKCAVEELKLGGEEGLEGEDADERRMLVKVVEGVAVTADRVEGLRAWDLKNRSMIAQVRLGDDNADATPSCIAVDDAEFEKGVLDIALGFYDGSLGVWRLSTREKRLLQRYRHERSSNGELVAMAFSYPYLLTATRSVLVSLYTFEMPSTTETGQEQGQDDGKGEPEVHDRSTADPRVGEQGNAAPSLPEGPGKGSEEKAQQLPAPYLLTSLDSHTSRPPLALSIRKAAKTTITSVAYTFSTRLGWSIGLQDLHIRQTAAGFKSIPEITTTKIAYTTPVEAGGVSHFPPPLTGTPRRPRRRDTLAADSPPTTNPGPAQPEPGPTTLCYTHPYLLATLPDNTLVLHMCNSTASSLSISDGIRLWGHTSGISDAEITARGKAVSVSTRGEEMRVWELEGRSAGAGSRSVEIRPWQSPALSGGGLAGDGLQLGDPARDWDERRNWVGFDDEMVIVLKERKGARESLMVYDFT